MANGAFPDPFLLRLFGQVNDKRAGIQEAVLGRSSAILWQLPKTTMTLRVGKDWRAINEIHVNCAVAECKTQDSRADFSWE